MHDSSKGSEDKRSTLLRTFLPSLLLLAFFHVSSTPRGRQQDIRISERRSSTAAAASGIAIESMSNKVKMVETAGDGDLLLVHVWTGIYHTRGSTDPNIPNIAPTCSHDDAVAIRLDASMLPDSMELDLMEQMIKTAQAGPFRIKFTILEGDCEQVGGKGFPVAIGTRLIQDKPGPAKGPE